jgi:hypothetical protein
MDYKRTASVAAICLSGEKRDDDLHALIRLLHRAADNLAERPC